jgi:hypothetical protein
MENPTANRVEQIKLEQEALIEVYNALRSEVILNLEAARQTVNITFVAVGVVIAGFPFIIQLQFPVIFLFPPVFFFALAWGQVRYNMAAASIGDHIGGVVLPRICQNLAELTPTQNRDFSPILNWEVTDRNVLRPKRLLMLPIIGADYALPLLGALLSVSAYLTLVLQAQSTIPVFDAVLLILYALAFVYSAVQGFRLAVGW